ncbi:hypothetical protein [Terrabacter sp. NPDC080008]|uniref:hypothetical protein n=1 Tax=Terrabacter sp. NPDC080008 TaxID=3155176 RepID=UPI00344BA6E2
MTVVADGWYLIKTVPDLFRNEPINVGVMVTIDGEVGSRFFAQDERGRIDGRRLPRTFPPLSTYREWVSYFSRVASEDGLEERLQRLAERPREMVVERRGGFAGDTVSGTPQQRADALFAALVDDDRMTDIPTVDASVDDLFRRLDATIDRDVDVRVRDKGGIPTTVHFRYRHTGNHVTLMDRVHLGGGERRVSQAVNDLLFRIRLAEKSAKVRDFLVMHDEIRDSQMEHEVERIERYANVVDVTSNDPAQDVAAKLGVGLVTAGDSHRLLND